MSHEKWMWNVSNTHMIWSFSLSLYITFAADYRISLSLLYHYIIYETCLWLLNLRISFRYCNSNDTHVHLHQSIWNFHDTESNHVHEFLVKLPKIFHHVLVNWTLPRPIQIRNCVNFLALDCSNTLVREQLLCSNIGSIGSHPWRAMDPWELLLESETKWGLPRRKPGRS